MDACAPALDIMMYMEPGDIWIFKVATLDRIINPEHVHKEAFALAELPLVHELGAFGDRYREWRQDPRNHQGRWLGKFLQRRHNSQYAGVWMQQSSPNYSSSLPDGVVLGTPLTILDLCVLPSKVG